MSVVEGRSAVICSQLVLRTLTRCKVRLCVASGIAELKGFRTRGQAVERRLSAILTADVVGYSRLMGEDEAGTLTAIKELLSLIHI